MAAGPEWFAPKRFGYGAGLPITWQGWAVTILFLVITVLMVTTMGDHPLSLLASLVLPSAAFIWITAKTTRGGWRWRWGGED